MKLRILRVEDEIVNVEIDNGTIINIARRWFSGDIHEDDVIEFDVNRCE